MNKKILEAFARSIRELNQLGERRDSITQQIYTSHAQHALTMVVEVAKQFNSHFDEARFRKACRL
jgi:hypothetical protein